MSTFLKDTIEQSDKHMMNWWNGTGFVVGHWGTGFPADLEEGAPEGADLTQWYTDPQFVAEREERRLLRKEFPLDTLPIAFPDINTLPIALYLGAQPQFSRTNIWYSATDIAPDNDRPLVLDESNEWFRNHLAILDACKMRSAGRYLVGMPALVPNLDVLAELRGVEPLMMDLVLELEWVHEKLSEINRVFFETYARVVPYVTDEKGWSTHAYFMLRAPGKVGLAHCDAAALISQEMYREFVLPHVREQCEYLDYSLYHVDGPDALRSVEPLLEIEGLRAMQFTPGPKVPQGGDPRWYELYKRIKAAGKSVMAVWIEPEEIEPLFDAVGPEGMYIMVNFTDRRQVEEVARIVEGYR